MPLVIKTNKQKIKDGNGVYHEYDMLSDTTTEEKLAEVGAALDEAKAAIEDKKDEASAAIEAKGESVLESLPDDYIELSTDYTRLSEKVGNVPDGQNLADDVSQLSESMTEISDDVKQVKADVDSATKFKKEVTGNSISFTGGKETEIEVMVSSDEIADPFLVVGKNNLISDSVFEPYKSDMSDDDIITFTIVSSSMNIKILDDYEFEPNTSYTFIYYGMQTGGSPRIILKYTDGTSENAYLSDTFKITKLVSKSNKTVDYVGFAYSSAVNHGLRIRRNSFYFGKTSDVLVVYPTKEVSEKYAILEDTKFITDGNMTISSYIGLKEYIDSHSSSGATSGYPTLEDMRKETEFTVGSVVETLGYYSVGDGGGAKYLIKNKTSESDNNSTTIVIGNYVATLMPENHQVNAKCFGIKAYGTVEVTGVDDTDLLNIAIQYSCDNKVDIIFDNGCYYFREINLKGKRWCSLIGLKDNNNAESSVDMVNFVAVGNASNALNAFLYTEETLDPLLMSTTSELVIKNIIFRCGNTSRTYGVLLLGATYGLFDNLTAHGNFAYGVLISTTWNSVFNRIKAKNFSRIGISFKNTTNGISADQFYAGTNNQNAQANMYIYGSHSVIINSPIVEGEAENHFICSNYVSNGMQLIINNAHAEKGKKFIKVLSEQWGSDRGVRSIGRVYVNGGIWTPTEVNENIRVLDNSDNHFNMHNCTFDNFLIRPTKGVTSIIPNKSLLDFSGVANLRESIIYLEIDNEDTQELLRERTSLRVHGVGKEVNGTPIKDSSRYGMSESFNGGFGRIYFGDPSEYIVKYYSESSITNEKIHPLIDYDGQELNNHDVVADIRYSDSRGKHSESYKLSITSDESITQDKTGKCTFGITDGYLTLSMSDFIRADITLKVKNLDYMI